MFRKKILLFLILIVLVSLATVLLGSRKQNPNLNLALKQPALSCRVVKHAMGEACIPLNPKRVLALNSSALGDALALLDVKPIAAMVDDTWEGSVSYYGKRIEGVQLIRTVGAQPNLEKALLLKPDLIIGLDATSESIYKLLSKIAPTVVLPWDKISYDWKKRFKESAAIFDKTELADQYMSDYNTKVEKLKETLKDRQSIIKASTLYDLPQNLGVGLKDSFIGSILHDADLLSTQHLTTGHFQAMSQEILSELDSNVFFIIDHNKNNENLIELLKQRPLWASLKAFKLNQVYLVDNEAWHGYNIFAAHAVLDDLFKYLVGTL